MSKKEDSSIVPSTISVPEIRIIDEVKLESKKTALIIVDMQNDFVHPDGKLFVPSSRKTIKPIRELLERARGRGVLRIFTMDTHYPGDPEFELWGEHVLRGSWGWRIIDELSPREDEVVIEKTRYDGFYGTPLDDILRTRGISNVVVVGTVANICVLHTAGSAALRWYRVIVPMDCISALNDFDYVLALRQISFLYSGVIVRSSENVKFE